MRTYPECIPCVLRASLSAGRIVGAAEGKLWRALQETAAVCTRWEREQPPLALGAAVAEVLRRELGEGDPFAPAKREGNAKLLALYPKLKERVRTAPDPLAEAMVLAAAANALDLGVHEKIDFLSALERALASPLGRWDFESFLAALAKTQEVLYLADNAGEIVADRILIEELLAQGKQVTLAVRGGPILNDVTLADLAEIGLPEEVQVITTGADIPGILLPLCSPEFRARFREAKLVISKGMGNFEGLSQERGPIFFLFQAKCFPVAAEAGVRLGDLALIGPGVEGGHASTRGSG
ncbi:MAG: ARMT1-like domain-containing protein [Candidatus Bipolaricaulota bacterium]|nr:ARMT1-like domain-containing protein [Candidatus Bipolaricaulota bacterium]MDW8126479.1 ARMT1-like domain-containing protein [Candidatus Bipolaricaulota bacterium]